MEATLRGKSPFCNLFCLTCVHAKLFQSCSTLCNSRDCSPYGFSVHGIPQGRILEWIAMPSSRGSLKPRDQTCIFCIFCIGRCILYH